MNSKLSDDAQALVDAWVQAQKTQTRTAGRYSALAAFLRATAYRTMPAKPMLVVCCDKGEQKIRHKLLAIANELDPVRETEQRMNDRIVIDGITYVREQQQSPDHVKFWYLNDNHTFTRLEGNSLKEIVTMAFVLSRTPTGAWGSLCPAILMCGHKEVRRVGPMVHARGANDSRDKWNEGIQEWIKALSVDQDVMRLLAEKDQSIAPQAGSIE